MTMPAMPARLTSLRSFLFAPASHRGRAERALASTAHAAILDLEDAVASREKPHAREIAESLLPYRRGLQEAAGPARLLRINAIGTPFFAEDLALVERVDLDAVVMPKASVAALESLPDAFPPVYALIESAAGLREAFVLASSPRVACLMLGAVDLAADLGLTPQPDGAELLLARSQLVCDSRAANALAPIDGVWTQLEDIAGLEREATRARALGLRGKLCIHPRQVEVVNAAFAPDEQERDWARRTLEAYDFALARGEGAIVVDGELVDLAVVARARRLLGEAAPA